MACDGCGNCESIGRQVHWADVRESIHERLETLAEKAGYNMSPLFGNLEGRLQALHRGQIPNGDEVIDRFIRVTNIAQEEGVPLFAIEYASVTFGWSLNSALPVEVRKKAMTLFCDIYEASTL